jgi:proline iminopeptidase
VSLLLLQLVFVAACDSPEKIGGQDGSVTTDTVEVNGTHLFVRREGSGAPIVIVHGGPVLDHSYLVGSLRPLGSDHELLYYDQRLSGRSAGSVDSASVTLENFVADLEGLRRELELGRIHVLGHSWGGLIAMNYALAHPGQLRSLVLVSPMAPSATLWQQAESTARAAITPADTVGMGELRESKAFKAGEPDAIERMLRLSFRSQLADPSDTSYLDFHIEENYRERSRQFGYLLPELTTYDLTRELQQLRVPTLLVFGAAERGMESTTDTLRALLPQVTVRRIAEAGHFVFLERSTAFRRVLRDFLRQEARASAGP